MKSLLDLIHSLFKKRNDALRWSSWKHEAFVPFVTAPIEEGRSYSLFLKDKNGITVHSVWCLDIRTDGKDTEVTFVKVKNTYFRIIISTIADAEWFAVPATNRVLSDKELFNIRTGR